MTTTQTHTKKRFFKITVLFILLCLCTHIFMPRNVDFTRINPADYRWALLSKKYRSGSIAPENEQGYLFFVTADGRSTSVKIEDAYNGNVVWSPQSFFYSDNHVQRWLSNQRNSLRVRQATASPLGIVPLTDGLSQAILYENYSQSSGNNYQLMIANPHKISTHNIRSDQRYNAMSECGNNVFAVTAEAPDATSHVQLSFDRVLKEEQFDSSRIASQSTQFDAASLGQSVLPCYKSSIIMLAHFSVHVLNKQSDLNIDPSLIRTDQWGSEYFLALVTMNTVTGDIAVHPVTDSQGAALDADMVSNFLMQYDAHSVTDDGSLIWVADNGSVLKTRIADGQTTIFSDSIRDRTYDSRNQKYFYCVSGTDATLGVLIYESDYALHNPHIVSLSKQNGRTIRDITILSNAQLGANFYLQDLVTNPSNPSNKE